MGSSFCKQLLNEECASFLAELLGENVVVSSSKKNHFAEDRKDWLIRMDRFVKKRNRVIVRKKDDRLAPVYFAVLASDDSIKNISKTW